MNNIIVPLFPPPSAITAQDVARALYRETSTVPFEVDFADYRERGCVHIRPDMFAMARIIDLNDEPCTNCGKKEAHYLSPFVARCLECGTVYPKKQEPAWFVRMCVGPIKELIKLLEPKYEKICFCRRVNEEMRVYPLAKFQAMAQIARRKGIKKNGDTSPSARAA